MEHEFVFVDGVNINATHLLGMEQEKAVKELLANDQIPGKDEAEKKAWIGAALGKAKEELAKRADDRKKKVAEAKARLEPQQEAPAPQTTQPSGNK